MIIIKISLSIICSSTESMRCADCRVCCLVKKKRRMDGLNRANNGCINVTIIFIRCCLVGYSLWPNLYLDTIKMTLTLSSYIELSATLSRSSNESRLEFILFPTIGINFNFSFSTGMFQLVQSFQKCPIQHFFKNKFNF